MAKKTEKGSSVLGRLLAVALLLIVLGAGAAGAWLYGYANKPLPVQTPVEFVLQPGGFGKTVQQLQAQGVIDDATSFTWLARVLQAEKQIKAGNYTLTAPTTPRQLLTKLIAGETAMLTVKIIDGWSWRQVRAMLAANNELKHDATTLSDADLVATLQLPAASPEGQFYPDTYYISRGGSELQLLKRAHRLLQQKLDAAWAQRAPDLPLKNPQEALILASLVEKETGKPSDRPEIAGVFINRLRLGMRLQTDPTVIFGLGDAFNGNLRRVHLETDTPYNTYTRAGLTPTPIAFVGEVALKAATQPAQTKALYFVARGDGSSQFSATLAEHNAAVRRYQLKQ